MSNESTPVIIAAAVSGVVCLLLGGVAAYFLLMPAPTAPTPIARTNEPAATMGSASQPGDNVDKTRAGPTANGRSTTQTEVEKLRKGNSELVSERDKLREEKEGLEKRLGAIENELKAIKALDASRRGKLAINFGSYDNVEALQSADWKDLGAALHSMTPGMLGLAESMRQGKPPDAEAMEKIQKENMKLVKLAVALDGKVASNAGNFNGEFTHPVTVVNLLAAQLEAAGDPLTADQKLKLAEVGEEYEKRWKTLQQGYNDETFALQKMLDEADIKMWFTERMFAITSQQQKAKVVDPSVEGLMGLDLYSPGLLLAPYMRNIRVNDKALLKAKFKEWLAPALDVLPATLDGQEYAFDEWQNLAGAEPVALIPSRMIHVQQVLQAGRAQLTLMRTLGATALSSPENLKKLRKCMFVGVPQVVLPE